MMKHMDEITKASLSVENAKRTAEESELRKSCITEIDELWEKKANGITEFLKLLEVKYVSYMPDKEVKFTEKDLQSTKLRSTLRKACLHYHPDKKTLSGSKFGED